MNNQIELELERIRNKIIESYEVLEELGAILPQDQNSYNLVETIRSLSPEELVELVTKNNDILTNALGEQITNEMIHNLNIITNPSEDDLLLTEDNSDTMNLSLEALTDYVLN
ncbi:MAG: hypothetical protein IKO49_01970 [Bacilli bacterium]|nr:hypothetical protein [Clostridia bacterium]MBR4618047.1 hypothetical protein [Bacilli bacterium]